ncbi:MAG: sugar ABC transporter permease [Alphaproteobacteria bacterium]|nr:sugar ABC transporter permease [Alphaproteobacteria bacterium]
MTPRTETPPATFTPGRTRPSARGFLGWVMAPQRRGPLLIAPAIATLVVVNIFPLMWSYGLSFFHYNAKRIAVPPHWRGFGNYVDLLSDSDVWGRFQNTAVIVIGSVAVQLVVGFLLALLFSREFPLRRYLLMLVLAPMMLSLSAVGVFFKLFYEPTLGFIPRLVQEFTGQPFVILDTPVKANVAIICADAWMWSPFVMLLVLAGLVSVPKYLYEAAEIDRASAWRRFRTITFPYIRSLLLLALLFRTIETFKIFDVPYVLTEGGPGTSTETISVYLFRVAFNYFQTGRASALGYIVLFGVIVLTSLYLYAIQVRRETEGPSR